MLESSPLKSRSLVRRLAVVARAQRGDLPQCSGAHTKSNNPQTLKQKPAIVFASSLLFLSVCPLGGPLGDIPNPAFGGYLRGQVLGAPGPRVTSVLTPSAVVQGHDAGAARLANHCLNNSALSKQMWTVGRKRSGAFFTDLFGDGVS